MNFFNNKLSRINFLILALILPYLYVDMSNRKDSSGIAQAALSVVNINVGENILSRNAWNNRNDQVAGSGILISEDGYIITNLHVVAGRKKIIVELDDGQAEPAQLIGFDQRADLAVLKISSPETFTPIKWADSKNVEVGDEVIAIGNAFGLGKTFTSGIISATGRDYGNPYLELIQTDAAINPGNSGGALLNHRGNLIGMNTKIFSKTGSYAGIGFALPSNKMISLATEIIKSGTVQRSWIGDFRVKLTRFLLNNELIYGLEILELKEYGPLFDKGKARVGAVIIAINNDAATWENLTNALQKSFPGDAIDVTILQNNNISDMTLITEAQKN
ncbi:trypsin-like peptidase domain-containing protein [Gammaproteobacteria bacterium]|nr:trypsin-like peptidase domain-containing protein [Gammaproteobacteria bacterium]